MKSLNSNRRNLFFALEGQEPHGQRGFTLVEMLVAVGLVVLMMSLFAEIFQLATNAMQKQKAIAELDQKARMVETVLKADLNCRTFRDVSPFAPNDSTGFENRMGYLYISENSPSNDTDDVLQLTVDKRRGPHPDSFPFYGRTTRLKTPAGAFGPPNQPDWPDQPEYDDGQSYQTYPDATGTAFTAEVAYFVRAGVLYRRVLLIRQPLGGLTDGKPKDNLGNPLSTAPYQSPGPKPLDFWNDFDYSAFPSGVAPNVTLNFNDPDSLNNTTGTVFPLGFPNHRFGHDWQTGLPREYIPGPLFIGRFTHRETSSPNFGYPGNFAGTAGNPMNPTLLPGAVALSDANSDGIVDQFANGPRVSEDILLSNVYAFDIKVWDPGVNTGPDGKPGFAIDTTDSLGNVLGYANDNKNYTGGNPVNTMVNELPNQGLNQPFEQGWPGSDDGAFVDLGHGIFPGYFASSANPYYGNRFDTWNPRIDLCNNNTFAAGADGKFDLPPFRRMGFGVDRRPGIGDLDPPAPSNPKADDDSNGIIDFNANGTPDAGEIGAGDDTPIPLRAIQIKIRYLDVTSNQMRELTIITTLMN